MFTKLMGDAIEDDHADNEDLLKRLERHRSISRSKPQRYSDNEDWSD